MKAKLMPPPNLSMHNTMSHDCIIPHEVANTRKKGRAKHCVCSIQLGLRIAALQYHTKRLNVILIENLSWNLARLRSVLTDLLHQVQDFRSDVAGRLENLRNETQAVTTTQVRILGHLGVEGLVSRPALLLNNRHGLRLYRMLSCDITSRKWMRDRNVEEGSTRIQLASCDGDVRSEIAIVSADSRPLVGLLRCAAYPSMVEPSGRDVVP